MLTFARHWMFTAGLIVLTNSFFNVYDNTENDSIVQIALAFHQYCAETDLQSRRYLTILMSFQKTVAESRASSMQPSKDFGRQDPIENLFTTAQPVVTDMGSNSHGMIANYAAAPNTNPPVWDWMPKASSSDVMQDITRTDVNGCQPEESVEGLVYPGAEDLIGPDLGTIHEEIIHFDALWPLNQDSTGIPGQIPMYGTTNFT